MNTAISTYSTEINLNTIFIKRTNVFNLFGKSNNYLLFFFYNNIWFFISPLTVFTQFMNNVFSNLVTKKTKSIFFSKQFKNKKVRSKQRPSFYKHLLQIPVFKTSIVKKTRNESKYFHHNLFIPFYSKLFRFNYLRIVTPLLRANPYQFVPQSKTPFKKFFQSKNFCRVVNVHKRLKFLELIANVTKTIKITSLKEKQLTDFKNFVKSRSTSKKKNFHFLLPRQNIFLHTRKQLNFTACKPISTTLLAQMLSIYKRGIKKNSINLTSSMNRRLTLQNFLKRTRSFRMSNLNVIPLFARKDNKRSKLKRLPRGLLLIAIGSLTDRKNLLAFKKSFKTYIGTRLHINKKKLSRRLRKIKKIRRIKRIKLIKKLKKQGLTYQWKRLYNLHKFQEARKLQKKQFRAKFLKKRKWKNRYKSKKLRYTFSLRKNKKSYVKFSRITLRRIGIRTTRRLQTLSFQKLTLTLRHSLAPINSITNKWLYLCFKLHIKNKQKTRFKRLNFLKKKNFKKRIKRRRSKKSKLVKRINPKKLKIFFSTNKISRQVLEKYKARAAARQLKKTHKLHKGKNEKVVKPKIKTNLKHNSFLKKKFTYFNFKNNRVNWRRRGAKYTRRRRKGTRFLVSKLSLIQRRWLLNNTNRTIFLKNFGTRVKSLKQKSPSVWDTNKSLSRNLLSVGEARLKMRTFSDEVTFLESWVDSVNADDNDPISGNVYYLPYITTCWESRFLNVVNTFERHLKKHFNRNYNTDLDKTEINHFKKEIKKFLYNHQWLREGGDDVHCKILEIIKGVDQYLTTNINLRPNLAEWQSLLKLNPDLEYFADEEYVKKYWPFLGFYSIKSISNSVVWKNTRQYATKTNVLYTKKKTSTIKRGEVNEVCSLYNTVWQKVLNFIIRKDSYFKWHKPKSRLSLHNSLAKYINTSNLDSLYRNALIARKPFIQSFKFLTFDLNVLFKHVLNNYLRLSPHLKPTIRTPRSPRVPKDYHLFSKYNRSFISSSTGFLFTNCNFLYHKRFKLDALKVSHLNRQRYSFFYKNDIKRFYLNRSSNLSFLQNLDKSNFLRNNLIYDRLYLRKNHHQNNSLNSIFTNSIANTAIDSFFLKYRNFRKAIDLWGDEKFFYTHQTVTSQLWEPKIKRIRFKPGYQRIWRKAREGINFSLKFNLRYQHRLTHKLAKLRFIKHKCTSRIYDLTLLKVLLNTRFVYDLNVSKSLISNSLVYVNGIIASNPQLLLYVGDFIQLVISIKYYIVYRWLVNWNFTQRARLVKLAFYKSKAKHDAAKQKSRILPDWIFNIGSRQLDIPKYTEVDYFTLSIFIIYEPLSVNEFNPLLFLDDRSHILNMYNWKFIN